MRTFKSELGIWSGPWGWLLSQGGRQSVCKGLDSSLKKGVIWYLMKHCEHLDQPRGALEEALFKMKKTNNKKKKNSILNPTLSSFTSVQWPTWNLSIWFLARASCWHCAPRVSSACNKCHLRPLSNWQASCVLISTVSVFLLAKCPMQYNNLQPNMV